MTEQQIHDVAKSVVNVIVSDLLFEHPPLLEVVNELKDKGWNSSLDDVTERAAEILKDRFGVFS